MATLSITMTEDEFIKIVSRAALMVTVENRATLGTTGGNPLVAGVPIRSYG